MHAHSSLRLLSFLTACAFTQAAGSDLIPLLEKVADWQLQNPARYHPTDWTNAAGFIGIMELSKISPSPRFRDALVKIGETNGWKLGPDTYDADDHCIGQIYCQLRASEPDDRMIRPMRACFDAILAHPKDGRLEFDRRANPDFHDRWSWCDSLFMAPPAWIRLWKVTGNRAYLDFAVARWWQTSEFLYDPQRHLFYRDSTFFKRTEKNGAPVFWGRGNGWVVAGLARFLEYLPPDHPQRPRFEAQFREMCAAILACQQPDGLWRSSLLDPESYPMKEASGSSFFCFAFAWGVNHRLLPAADYQPAATRAWDALTKFVEADGRLTHVQPIGATPQVFDERHTEPFGVGAFLLAGTQMVKLQPEKPAKIH